MNKVERNLNKKAVMTISIIALLLISYIFLKSILNNKFIIGIEINILILIFLFYLNLLIKKTDFIFTDIRFPLILGFIIYNIYTPILFCIDKSTILEYPKVDGPYQQIGYVFSESDLKKSLLISILFFIGLAISLILNQKTYFLNNKEKNTDNKKNENKEFYFWLILFIMSFLWYIYPYIKLGFGVLQYGRWYRYSFLFNSVRDSLGGINKVLNAVINAYLILISLFKMYICVLKSNKKFLKCLFWSILIFYSIFMLLIDVRRRELSLVLLMISCYYLTFIRFNDGKEMLNKKLKNMLIAVILIGTFFIAYQNYKNYFAYAYKNGVSQMLEYKDNRVEIKLHKYENEFSLVYLVNLSGAKYFNNYIYGKSYFESFFRMIPELDKILWEYFDYDKRRDSLMQIMYKIYPNMISSGGGLGYSPSFEAYINFGYVGCLIMGMVIGVLFNILRKKLFQSKSIIYYCIVFCLMFNFSRTTFLGFTQEFFWLSIYYFIYNSTKNLILLKYK